MASPNFTFPQHEIDAHRKESEQDLAEVVSEFFNLEKDYPERFVITADIPADWKTFRLQIVDQSGIPPTDSGGDGGSRVILDDEFVLIEQAWAKSVARVLTQATGVDYVSHFEQQEQEEELETPGK